MMTIHEVMEKYEPHLTYNQVMYAIMTKKIKATKLGWQWFVEEESLPKNWHKRG
jgi:hypothetical protein